MTDYSFRLRFKLPPSEKINIDDSDLVLLGADNVKLKLSSGEPDKSIKDTKVLVLHGAGYPTSEAAEIAGEQHRNILTLTLAKLHIGADFGDRAPQSGVTIAGTEYFKNLFNLPDETRLLHDLHGLMVYETIPTPKFVRLGDARLVRGTQKNRFIKGFELSININHTLNESEKLAYDIFSASYIEGSQDARFLLLVMAIEVLISVVPRSEKVTEHVNLLIHLTREAEIPENEQDSICGSLSWLLSESIGQAGQRLAREQLGGRKYMNMPAPKFFTYCYHLRSRLIHGQMPIPSRDEITSAAASLEGFVADLLCGDLRTVEI